MRAPEAASLSCAAAEQGAELPSVSAVQAPACTLDLELLVARQQAGSEPLELLLRKKALLFDLEECQEALAALLRSSSAEAGNARARAGAAADVQSALREMLARDGSETSRLKRLL